MKKFNKIFTLALASLFASISLNSCDGNGFFSDETSDEISLDPNKTTIYIGNYYGGLGDEWLNQLTKKYCETHPDVQFKIDNDKNTYLLDNIQKNIKTSRCALFFIEKIYYYDMVNSGYMADITDVVTSSLSEYGETGSIEDKLDEQYKNYLAYNDVCDDKYYALPTYMSHHGLIYDVDLFENKKLFISKDSTDSKLIFISGTGNTANNKSLGLDGIAGTYDDGLPTTFEEFKLLMNEMIKKGVSPFIWSGANTKAYFNGMLENITADYEGKDNYLLNYTFDGSITLDGDSTPTTITSNNAYELQRQSGRKYALEFARYITDSSAKYASSSSLLTSTHLEAQDEYISSFPYQGTDGIKPIGMLIDGDWWENEANINGDFSSIVASKGEQYAYGNRRFSIMPFPKQEGSSTRTTFLNGSAQNAFFVSNSSTVSDKQREIAKDFLKFCHTESALQTFTEYTGMVRPYTYSLTDAQYNSLTNYSKTLYDVYKSDNVDIVHDLNISNLRIQNSSYFLNYWSFTTMVGSNVYENPANDFINNTKLTASDYFNGLITYQKSRWNTLKK